jgi:hypothetical protein
MIILWYNMRYTNSNSSMTDPFQTLSNSSFNNHRVIQPYTACATERIIEFNINK